ncbi:hypothetical protein [Alishewanella longhuensis]
MTNSTEHLTSPPLLKAATGHAMPSGALPLDFQALSQQIENWLVARNLRGMQLMQPHLRPGYLLRAARLLPIPPQAALC